MNSRLPHYLHTAGQHVISKLSHTRYKNVFLIYLKGKKVKVFPVQLTKAYRGSRGLAPVIIKLDGTRC
jgi:hypothetical protein